MTVHSKPRGGFTLIELLTVIAIIALLAAILFPVFSNVRKQAAMTSCMDNLRSVGQAVKLYREDNGHYPATLLGYAEQAGSSSGLNNFYSGSGSPLGASAVNRYRPLTNGQKYLKDVNFFQCPHNSGQGATAVSTAYYPVNLKPALANLQVVHTPLTQHAMGTLNSGSSVLPDSLVGQPAYFYALDSYDTGVRVNADGTTALPAVRELHYSLDWTGGAADPSTDSPNQLKFPNPPSSTTVITWCTWHVGNAHMDKIPVLMLSGSVKPVPVSQWVGKGPLQFTE